MIQIIIPVADLINNGRPLGGRPQGPTRTSVLCPRGLDTSAASSRPENQSAAKSVQAAPRAWSETAGRPDRSRNNSRPENFHPASASAKRRGHNRHVPRVGWRRTKYVQTTSQISAAARRGENPRVEISP